MILRLTVVCAVFAIVQMSLTAQEQNPFELRWRVKGNDTELLTPEPEMVAPDTPVVMAADSSATLADVNSEEDSGQHLITSELPSREQTEAVPPPAPPEKKAPERITTVEVRMISPAVILLLLGLSLALIAWVLSNSRGFLRKVYRAALNDNYAGLLLREQRFSSAQYLYYLMYVSFFINAGLFLYLVTRHAAFASHLSNTPFLVVFIVILAVYLGRHLTNTILGNVFPVGSEFRHFNFSIILFNILAGIILIPLNLIVAFGPQKAAGLMIGIGLAVLLLLYAIRQARGVLVGRDVIALNPFQFFVYLCAIEILPVLVLLKLLHN